MKKYLYILLAIIALFFAYQTGLQAEESLDQLQKQIDEYTQKLAELSKTKDSLSKQINLIDGQVQLTLLKISQTQASVTSLEKEISELSVKILGLDSSLNQLSSLYLSQVTQNYKLSKRIPNLTFLATNSNFNHFLEEYKYLSIVQKNNQDTLLSLETARANYDQEKTIKETKQTELESLKKKLDIQQKNLSNQKASKAQLLALTNNDEKKYQQLLTEAQNQLRQLKNFSSTAGGSSCLSSPPGNGSDGNFYSQRDPVWCKQLIGNSSDTIGSVGCYITSISMAFKKIGTNTTPSIYATDPLKFTLNTAYAKDPIPPTGYTYKSVAYNTTTIDNELKAGRYVIVQVRMSTVSGMHFIVIISGSNGKYKIHDPWYGPDLDFTSHYSVSQVMSLRLITK